MRAPELKTVGFSPTRVDAIAKAKGEALFVSDLSFAGLWEACIVTSSIAHGVLKRVEAPKLTDRQGIALTYRDIPGVNQIGIIHNDQEFLAVDRVRSTADRLALVAAPSESQARLVAEKVRYILEPLPIVDDPERAVESDVTAIHPGGNLITEQKVKRGDVEAAFARADVVVEGVYRTGYQEHAYLEPQGAVAVPTADGRMTIYTSCQCPFYVRTAVARILGLPHNMVRVVQSCTGGAFGGKEDYPSEVAASAALLAFKTGHPVRLIYDRTDDFRWSSKRHRTVINHKLAALNSGEILAMRVDTIFDAGAYTGLSVVVAERGNSSACGPYSLSAVDVRTRIVYTNNLFAGAFRGFGAPQVTFATERQIDLLSERLSMDPVKIREMNLWRTGSTTASGEVLEGIVATHETLHKAITLSDYNGAIEPNTDASPESALRGVGIATSYYGNNLHKGGERLDRSQAWVGVNPDGSINVAVGLTEMGQGLLTAVAQIVAEELGIGIADIRVDHVDTDRVQDSGPTVASRGTIMSGMSAQAAAKTLRTRIIAAARQHFGRKDIDVESGFLVDEGTGEKLLSWEGLVSECYARRVEMTALGYYKPPERPYNAETGQGKPYSTNSYSTHVAEVEVDPNTGLVKVISMTAVHDIGRAINLKGVGGQIEGGIVQGAGLALWEELKTENGILLNPGFTDYAVPTIGEMPETRWELVEHPWDGGPFGAKGIGEPSLIGVPAAIANAVSNALGKPIFEIPLTPERVLDLLES